MKTRTPAYGIFTPAFNEGSNLIATANGILSQDTPPAIWLVIDDGSTDSTPEIAESLAREHRYIEFIRRSPGKERSDLGLAEFFNLGLRVLSRKLAERGLDNSLLGKVDADIVLHPSCFSKLVDAIAQDPRCGVIGPAVGYLRPKAGRIVAKRAFPIQVSDEPSDGARLYRLACLSGCGWLPISPSPDTGFLQIARSSGWGTLRLSETLCWTLRRTGASTKGRTYGTRLANQGYTIPLASMFLLSLWIVDRYREAFPALLSYLESIGKPTSESRYRRTRTLRRQILKIRIGT